MSDRPKRKRCPNGTRKDPVTKECKAKDAKKVTVIDPKPRKMKVKKPEPKPKPEPPKRKKKIIKKVEPKPEPPKKKKKIIKKVEPKPKPPKKKKKIIKKVEPKPKAPKKKIIKNVEPKLPEPLKPKIVKRDRQIPNVVSKKDKPEELITPKTQKERPNLQDNIDAVITLYRNQKLDKPVPFLCNATSNIFYFTYIMKKNKNDCLLPNIYMMLEFDRPIEATNIYTGAIPEDDLPEIVANKYVECAKNNKILAIPFEVVGGHANMILLNPMRKELERYEPHGNRTLYSLGTMDLSVKGDKMLKKFTSNINKNIKDKKLKLTFIKPSEICPLRGWQTYEDQQKRKDTVFKDSLFPKGIDVDKDDGFCCVWSLMYLDYRLKLPNMSGKEIHEYMDENVIKKNPVEIKEFVRGLSKQLYDAYVSFAKKFVKSETLLRIFVKTSLTGEIDFKEEKYIGTISKIQKTFQKKMEKNLFDAIAD